VSEYTTKRGEETNLYRQAQAGDEESLNELMRMHEGLVHYVMRQQWRGSLSYEEGIHAGRIGLWRSIMRYDRQRGNSFVSYASVAIRRQVWRAVKEAEGEKRREKKAAATALCAAGEAEEIDWEVAATLYGMVGRLPDKQRWVVSCYYGLDGWGGSTLAELGARIGCCRQAVHYHLQRALLRLRHPTVSAILRALLGYNQREDYLGALRPVGRGR
jgi:RNA polymerase sigma factor (sigma-70 family)